MLTENGKHLVLNCKHDGIPTGTERRKADREAANERRSDLQDVFGKANGFELAEWYTASSQRDRECIVWVLANVQDKGVVHDALTVVVGRAEIADQKQIFDTRVAALEAEKKGAEEALEGAEDENAKLERELAAAQENQRKAQAGAARLVRRNNAAAAELVLAQRQVLGFKAACWDMHERTQHLEQLNADIQRQVAELLEQQAQ